jgi:hypothetical protein
MLFIRHFKFTAKIEKKIEILHTHTHTHTHIHTHAFSTTNNPYHSGTFVTTDESILTHHYHPNRVGVIIELKWIC